MVSFLTVIRVICSIQPIGVLELCNNHLALLTTCIIQISYNMVIEPTKFKLQAKHGGLKENS